MNIGVIVVPAGNWVKVSTLIQTLSGYSSFAFDTTKKYFLQVTDASAKVCKFAEKNDVPGDEGHPLDNVIYEPDTDTSIELYVKADIDLHINISEGE